DPPLPHLKATPPRKSPTLGTTCALQKPSEPPTSPWPLTGYSSLRFPPNISLRFRGNDGAGSSTASGICKNCNSKADLVHL
ncbi:hypothetical protein HPB47_019350, partial [Ixodes persulcatus]